MKAKFERWFSRNDVSARTGLILLFLLLLGVGIRSLLLVIDRPFWYDETITVFLSRLPTVGSIWGALDHAADTQPPFFYIVEHFARQLMNDDHLAYRLPSIIGAWMTIACIYGILSKRVSRMAALAGATFVVCTPLVTYYAAEARPYAFLVGCFSVAIFAWQRLDDSVWYTPVLVIALGAAASLHYYALLVWPAFFVAEGAAWFVSRRFRLRAWLSIAVGALPMLIVARILLHVRDYYTAHFWALPSIKEALLAHDWLFNMGGSDGHWGWTYAAGMTVILILLGMRYGDKSVDPSAPDKTIGIPAGELALTVVLLWLPLIAYVAAKVGHGGMTQRYMLPATIAGGLAMGYASEMAPMVGRVLLFVLLTVQYASSSISIATNAVHGSLLADREGAIEQVSAVAAQAGNPNLPIVATDELYLPMAYYTPADLQGKLFAITDPSSNLSFDDNLRILRQYVPLHAADYSQFIATHAEFLLVTDNDPDSAWPMNRLMQDGASFTLISPPSGDLQAIVYRVTVHR